MSAITKPILYSYWRSSCSWRVRIALNYKEIPYDIKPISIIKECGDQHTDEFRKINPMEKVPALHIDGITLVESLNIMHYLEETRPQKSLMPQDVVKRARVREICDVIVSGIQPLQNIGVLEYVGDENDIKKKLEWSQRWINHGFHALEKLLSVSAGMYSVGDKITLADCCVVPQVYNARKFKVNLEPFSTIVRIDKELNDHPAFKDTHPSNQPDCPSDFVQK